MTRSPAQSRRLWPTLPALIAVTAASVLGARPVPRGDEPLNAAERSALERLALARARTAAYETLRGLALGSGATLGEWAAGDAARDRALRAWARERPRFGPPRLYSDGSCDADVRIEPAEVRDWLVGLLPPAGLDGVLPAAVRVAAVRWPVIHHTGSAERRELSGSPQPLGWEDVKVEGLQLARLAAQADAALALLDEASRLKITNARTLSAFLESGEAVRDAVLDGIRQAARVAVRPEPDQVVVASASLNVTELIRILSDVHATTYRGELFHAADFREMALLAPVKELEATGLGVPPKSTYLKPPYEPIELDVPAWASEALTAVGRYEPRDEDGDLPEPVRAEMARLDGMNALRGKAESLVIQRDVTVEQLLAQRPELKPDVVMFLTGTRAAPGGRVTADGAYETRVELPLDRLWRIVRRGMTLVEVDPPEAAGP